jgi:hypothetical protein
MELVNKDGFEVMMPEKDWQGKFTDKKIGGDSDDHEINKKRRDSGTKAFDDPQKKQKRKDEGIEEEFREKSRKEHERQDMEDDGAIGDEQVLEDIVGGDTEGDYEHFFLKRKNGESVVISNETEFSDGSRGDGTRNEDVDSPEKDDPISLNEEIKIAEEDRQKGQFYSDRGNMGKRGEGHKI